MRLIDADALIESLGIYPEDCPGCPEPEWLEELADVLALAPTVDGVEVVRCKDCEYGEQDEVGRWFCISLGCQLGNEDGSGYCADAERRTDG